MKLWSWSAMAEYIGYGHRLTIRIPIPQWYMLRHITIHRCDITHHIIINAQAEPYKEKGFKDIMR